MALVDLRGHEGEPQVLALLDPDPNWLLVGWSRDGVLVACAGIERASRDDLAVRAVAAHDEAEAGALLDAIADVASGTRLVAAADSEAAAALRSAGFASETDSAGRVRLVRPLEEPPAARDTVAAASLQEIESAIRSAWSRETSDDPAEWSEGNRARGQCAVTAMIVRELLGGEILVANVLRDGRRVDRHAWNRLPSGLTVDLTRDQFVHGEMLGAPRVEEPLLTHRNPERFATLRTRVRAQLGLEG